MGSIFRWASDNQQPAMEFEIRVCSSCGTGLVQLSGQVDVQALCDVLNALLDHEDWLPDTRALWNVRTVTDLYITPAATQRLAHLARDLQVMSETSRTALLTRTTSQRAYGTVLLRTVRGGTRNQQTFQSVERALKWLDRADRAHAAPCDPDCSIKQCLSSAGSPS